MTKILLTYFTFLLALILIAACSELNTDIPAVPEINTHGDSLYSPASENYHPNTIASSPNGWDDCKECHAADFSGGVAKAGCNTSDCHPTINVHVAGVFDPSSENFHPKYLNVNNATMSSCSSCHGSDYLGGLISPSCANCHSSIGVHVDGIIDPVSENFHGNFIRNHNWDMRDCQNCHGNNYAGGLIAPSCLDCHTYPGGPENCSTCHGSATSPAPPRDLDGNTSTTARGVGAHQIHLGPDVNGKSLTCDDCHVVPGELYSPGHLDSDNRAEVIFQSLIAITTTNDDSSPSVPIDPNQPTYIPAPVYNPADLTCANTYCHGYFKNGNVDNKPVWNDPSTSQCGSCHGDVTSPLPKTVSQGGNHPNAPNCSFCHGGVVDANLKIINPSKHIDGLLNLFGNDIKY